MSKSKSLVLIGHRGAAGMNPENTIASIESAVAERVDMIEFDLTATKDHKLVLMHDPNTRRTTGVDAKISSMTYAEVRKLVTPNGEPIPSLHEALEACANTPVLLDCKGSGWADILVTELRGYDGPKISITSANRLELAYISQLMPSAKTFVSELTKPFGAVHDAKILRLTGVSLNVWILNPLSYWYAKHQNLSILVFTVNHAWLARWIHFFYPDVGIISNRPDLINRIFKRKRNQA